MNKPLDPRRIEMPDDRVVEALRALTPAQRLGLAVDCNRSARQIIAAQIRSLFPDWDEDQVSHELARRMLGGTA